jgi:hypothetical protein
VQNDGDRSEFPESTLLLLKGYEALRFTLRSLARGLAWPEVTSEGFKLYSFNYTLSVRIELLTCLDFVPSIACARRCFEFPCLGRRILKKCNTTLESGRSTFQQVLLKNLFHAVDSFCACYVQPLTYSLSCILYPLTVTLTV